MKVALSSANQGQKSDSVLARPLKNQAFASPDKVTELVKKVCHGYALHMQSICGFKCTNWEVSTAVFVLIVFLILMTGWNCHPARVA